MTETDEQNGLGFAVPFVLGVVAPLVAALISRGSRDPGPDSEAVSP